MASGKQRLQRKVKRHRFKKRRKNLKRRKKSRGGKQ